VCCFIPIYGIWNEKILYDSRYAPEDNLFHRALEIGHTCDGHFTRSSDPRNERYNPSSDHVCFFDGTCVLDSLFRFKRQHDLFDNVVGGPEAKENARLDWRRKVPAFFVYVFATYLADWDYFMTTSTTTEEVLGSFVESPLKNLPLGLCLSGWLMEMSYEKFTTFVLMANRNHKDSYGMLQCCRARRAKATIENDPNSNSDGTFVQQLTK
jgi:hypothetical protein